MTRYLAKHTHTHTHTHTLVQFMVQYYFFPRKDEKDEHTLLQDTASGEAKASNATHRLPARPQAELLHPRIGPAVGVDLPLHIPDLEHQRKYQHQHQHQYSATKIVQRVRRQKRDGW